MSLHRQAYIVLVTRVKMLLERKPESREGERPDESGDLACASSVRSHRLDVLSTHWIGRISHYRSQRRLQIAPRQMGKQTFRLLES